MEEADLNNFWLFPLAVNASIKRHATLGRVLGQRLRRDRRTARGNERALVDI